MSAADEKVDASRPPADARNGQTSDSKASKAADQPLEKSEASGPPAVSQQPPVKADTGQSEKKKGPAGGYDSTLPPRAPPGFTLKFTFHRAVDLPIADLNTFSADPYLLIQLNTSLPYRHKQDPRLLLRTPTVRRNVNPEWNAEWIIANVPADGFKLKARIYDEDPGDQDDRLGNVHVHVSSISEQWAGIHEQEYSIKKRMGSKRAYFLRGCAALFNRNVHMSGKLVVSVELLGRTEGIPGGRLFTVGPCAWSKHYSPLFGRLTGTKDPESEVGGKKLQRYNFQANQIQLPGPVPEELYHRYVEFKPFIAGMFNSKSLQGWLLNRALHAQHSKIYHYDRTTEYGSYPTPCKDMTLRFLDLVHYDKGGRIFTYVMNLDGLMRFTETGKEFGIDILSKHSMHSDDNIYIAFSGEFFIRWLKSPNKDPADQETHPPTEISGGPPNDDPPQDPSNYHLFIDNDSGTYRPNKDLLPLLKRFLQHALPGLKVTTLDCQGDAERMGKMKSEQRERRKAEGQGLVYMQGDDASSISSSEIEDLNERAGSAGQKGRMQKMVSKVKTPGGRFSDVVHGRQDLERPESRKAPLTQEAENSNARNEKASQFQSSQPKEGGEPSGVYAHETSGAPVTSGPTAE